MLISKRLENVFALNYFWNKDINEYVEDLSIVNIYFSSSLVLSISNNNNKDTTLDG